MGPPEIGARKRILAFLLLAVLFSGILLFRVGWLESYHGQNLREKALRVRLRAVPVQAPRGTILDREGRVLATSLGSFGVYAVPAQVSDKAGAARTLSGILEAPALILLSRLQQSAAVVWLKRHASQELVSRLREAGLPGIGVVPEARRFYPSGTLAAQVLGFAGSDNQGLEGVELSADHYLTGKAGAIRVEMDALNRQMPWAIRTYTPPVAGDTVVLSLDSHLQLIAERAARQAQSATGATGVSILVMDPNSGEILALANSPAYNPNAFGEYPSKDWRDPVVSDTFPPGSTFKPITLAAALQEKVVSANSRFYDPGYIKVTGVPIRCWKDAGHGSVDLAQVVANSCNIGFVIMGEKLGTSTFYRYLRAFGLLSRLGVDLPGEAKSIYPAEKSVRPVDLAVMAFGQTLAVTPLQLLTAISVIANGGELVRPHVVREVISAAGKVVKPPERVVIHRVLSADVAKEVTSLLVGVMAGTGKKAVVPGYVLAGKTGTAQAVVNGRYIDGQYIASFVGFGPVPDPRLATLVVIHRPVGEYYGGQIAAPVFAQVMGEALTYLKIKPNAPVATKPGEAN